MTDIVLKDIDPSLRERIERVARARGWSLPVALQHLLEQGLFALEGGRGVRGAFDPNESGVLEAAIAAMQDVPDDPGFARIGRVPDPSAG